MLRIKNLDAGWAALEELRREILAFRARGGRVVAYFADPADTRSYYLACAADEILATPLADLNVVGIRARVDFLKDALDNLGLEVEVVAVSPYKSAGETVRPRRLLAASPASRPSGSSTAATRRWSVRSPRAGASPARRCARG